MTTSTSSTLLLLFLVKVNHPHYQSITKIWSSQSHLVYATQCLKIVCKSHTTTKVIFWRENSNSPNKKIWVLFCFQRWASLGKNQLLNEANSGKNGAKIKIWDIFSTFLNTVIMKRDWWPQSDSENKMYTFRCCQTQPN